ncbi:hypothetical protein ACFLQV_04800, partial [Calditrichota bacterium]
LDLLSALSVRDEWKQIPVLVASDIESDQVFAQSMDHGAIGVMFKPFDLKVLRRHLNSLFPPRDLEEETVLRGGKLQLRHELKKSRPSCTYAEVSAGCSCHLQRSQSLCQATG